MTPIPCKVCGSDAFAFDCVDLARTCEDRTSPVFPASRVAVPYVRCSDCGLVFTTYFDGWSKDEFLQQIYNHEYLLTDPDFVCKRPNDNAAVVKHFFLKHAAALRILDYGGGKGRFAEALRSAGFPAVETFDPFSAEFSTRPAGLFQIVTCFETLEHMPDPRGGAADIASFLAPGGLLFSTTMIQPLNLERVGLGPWWYAAPRNGHVTLHTAKSLVALWKPFGLTSLSLNSVVHLAFQHPPPFARDLLAKAAAGG